MRCWTKPLDSRQKQGLNHLFDIFFVSDILHISKLKATCFPFWLPISVSVYFMIAFDENRNISDNDSMKQIICLIN